MALRIGAVVALSLGLTACGIDASRLDPVSVAIRSDHAGAAANAISDYRRSNGLSPVRVDPVLMRVAEHQARTMAETGTFSHEAGGSFSARLRRFDVRHRAAAENLSMGAVDVGEVMRRWKASSDHEANLRLPAATRIGFASAQANDARPRRYWVLVLAD